mmetsp:Transcript_30535/g.58849  ORF Transcript_30535/g.58849 Transcript_30535/m.58849 type:complete len:204 (-) Transcript_30535:339-950(-)
MRWYLHPPSEKSTTLGNLDSRLRVSATGHLESMARIASREKSTHSPPSRYCNRRCTVFSRASLLLSTILSFAGPLSPLLLRAVSPDSETNTTLSGSNCTTLAHFHPDKCDNRRTSSALVRCCSPPSTNLIVYAGLAMAGEALATPWLSSSSSPSSSSSSSSSFPLSLASLSSSSSPRLISASLLASSSSILTTVPRYQRLFGV